CVTNLQQTDLGRSLRLVIALVVDGRCLLGVRGRAQPVKEIAEFPREVPRGPGLGLDLVDFLRGDLRGAVRDFYDVRVGEFGGRRLREGLAAAPELDDFLLRSTTPRGGEAHGLRSTRGRGAAPAVAGGAPTTALDETARHNKDEEAHQKEGPEARRVAPLAVGAAAEFIRVPRAGLAGLAPRAAEIVRLARRSTAPVRVASRVAVARRAPMWKSKVENTGQTTRRPSHGSPRE
ncbi:unnamed protein product, partial [Pelagomonas calceolata]